MTQLHFVGSYFFATHSSAEEVSKLSGFAQQVCYPELGVLLGFLRRSKVLIFTYRARDEGREVRWTRLTAEDEFDQDCWTL